MQSSLSALLRQKERSFAILRSLGATSSFLLRHYLVIVFILSAIGCCLGILSGLLLEKGFSSLFAGLLPDKIVLGGSLTDVLEGMALGLSGGEPFHLFTSQQVKKRQTGCGVQKGK